MHNIYALTFIYIKILDFLFRQLNFASSDNENDKTNPKKITPKN